MNSATAPVFRKKIRHGRESGLARRGASDACRSRSLSSQDDLRGGATSRAHQRRRSGYADARGHAPLDGLLGANEVRSFLRLANAVAAALTQGAPALVNKDIEPANILSRIVLAYQSYSLLV